MPEEIKFHTIAHHYLGVKMIEVSKYGKGRIVAMVGFNQRNKDFLSISSGGSWKWHHLYDFKPMLKRHEVDVTSMACEEVIYFLQQGYDLFGLIDNDEAVEDNN
jgi:hypothetical protein